MAIRRLLILNTLLVDENCLCLKLVPPFAILVGSNPLFWLVVSNMTFIFHNIWDVILPIDELIVFKMVKTTNQNHQPELVEVM